MAGFIKLHRKILKNPVVCKDAEHFAIWTYLLLEATHKEYDTMFKGRRITLQPGQLITGRKSIANKFNISESKVQRVLKRLEIEHQIEQQTSNQNRLITIVNWSDYQTGERQIEQQLNNKRTTTEQQLNTNKNVKNIKNDKNINNTGGTPYPPKEEIDYEGIVNYYHAVCVNLPKIKKLTDKRKTHIRKRIEEHGKRALKDVIDKTQASDFLSGRKTDWKATFDWIINASNFIKILEGNYDNEEPKEKSKQNKRNGWKASEPEWLEQHEQYREQVQEEAEPVDVQDVEKLLKSFKKEE